MIRNTQIWGSRTDRANVEMVPGMSNWMYCIFLQSWGRSGTHVYIEYQVN